jgi:hypothetical protein
MSALHGSKPGGTTLPELFLEVDCNQQLPNDGLALRVEQTTVEEAAVDQQETVSSAPEMALALRGISVIAEAAERLLEVSMGSQSQLPVSPMWIRQPHSLPTWLQCVLHRQ